MTSRFRQLSIAARHRWIVMTTPARHTFPATHRLHGPKAFSAVYDAKTREGRGPLTVYALPNDTGHARLGLSVSRRVGNAVRRGRIKRLLREAFRHTQHEMPGAYDLVVVVRAHEPLAMAEYQKLLAAVVGKLHRTWEARRERARNAASAASGADAAGMIPSSGTPGEG